ncbi:putative repeat protein (TIGR01451 family)/fimbrial isopeptide formation D2 family protein [Paramicrobacterium agarici]|uniref:Putative repeat protein (TIGR01451 family)/fimbrial isopeptide formation D2 family protein n=2 Tax=Paramicrobacterium agarici TaxID=630514 RepID=A0A2A9DWT0_9MICO|nr:putative repeat protein (TIGR01451 family)/fimbrial isopeptide formation D2 family protein [Microbacterium agarici]
MGVVVALFAALLSFIALVAPASSAHAASTPLPSTITDGNRFFAYLKSGETLSVSVAPASPGVSMTVTVTDPDGAVAGGNGTYTATSEGIYTVETDVTYPDGLHWDITVRDGSTEKTGRVWVERYNMAQTVNQTVSELPLWMVNNSGYVYSVVLRDFNGIKSSITADSVGNAVSGEDCATPRYASTEYENAALGCGEQYRLFFEEPSDELPPSAQSAAGARPILPETLTKEDLEVTDLTYAAASPNSSTAGTLTWTPPQRYSGGYTIDIDADGNGSYDDDVDRSIPMGADGTGDTTSFEFDGLDAQGNPIATCVPVKARVHFDRLGEIHLQQNDVEQRTLSMTRLNGPGAPDSTMYWNDQTALSESRVNSTPITDGRAGIDSTGGAHGWAYDVNSWGNERWIDDWTYLPIDKTAATVSIAGSCLDIEKTSDMTVDSRPGDTITFEVTATNNGELPYTEDTPAVVTDDLSAVLDDAEYDDNAAASASDGSTTSDPSYAEPLIGWSGPLAVGESVTISYSVTLTGGGDGSVRNVAFAGGGETPVCDPPTEDGTDPDTGIPCAEVDKPMPKLSIAKVADRTDLPGIGETVTYTVTIANEGPGDYTDAAPATFTDDFTDVLDDATFDESTIDASAGEATYDGPTLSWSGALAAGAEATVSYTFTYTGGGDNVLRNAACVPEDEVAQGAAACSTRTVPTGALTQSKAVNPDSGSEVRAGQEVTYTLTFNSVGEATVDVSTYDDLSDLLDDAALTGDPVVDGAGLTAVVDGERIVIEGSIAAGDTVTVTYTVVVNAYEEQGDHSLGNVLADPDGTACAEGACETENPVQHLSVEKTSDAQDDVNTGDTVTYEVTVTNDGESDFTEDATATAHDDLAGVLDDAQWNDDASAESGALSYDEPTLTWTGSLAAGASVTITYTVTITNQGDHELANVASLPDDLCDDADAPCESTVTTPLPHVTPAKSSDPATGEDVAAGQDVTYTLSFTNDGQAAGPVDSTDDLSGVLDDAELTGDPVSSSSAVQAILDGDALRVTGSIEPGETVTVTYVVTIGPDGERGDNVADNVLTPDTPPYVCAEDDPECDPFVPPTTSHNMGELDDWKTVDPASGSTVRPGQAVTYTLHFENTGTADIDVARDDVLTQVLDDAQVSTAPTASDESLTVSDIEDGRFTVAGTLEAGQLVTVTYTVTVNADGERGDDRLGNFLVDEGAEPPATCEPADGERADCTVNHVSNVVVTKSADPASGAQVGEGQEVTYTITFVNVSTNADAEAVAVDYTDHMSDVLDDATLTGNPAASSDDVSTTVSADTIVMAGAVATGETIRVTYTVTVKDYDEQGNHVLGNVIAVTGEEPVCAPDSPLCTSHETTKPAPSALPWTGVDGAVPALIAALLLLISGGTALIMVRRRREAGDIE